MSNAEVTLSGNITVDPELKYTTGETARLSFSIACNKSFKRGDDWVEETSFFNVVVWRNLAEQAASVLEKGMPIVVTGELKQDTWEDKEGNKRSTVNVIAKGISVNVWGIESLERRRGQGGSGGSRNQSQSRNVPDNSPFDSAADPFESFV